VKQISNYYSVSRPAQAKIEINKSRFLGLVYPVRDEKGAKSILEMLQEEYPDASHICYAYRLIRGEEEIFKTYDAGEPNFTAGKPILNAILGQKVGNVLVVVVRWFGGIKLGKANLARAYRQAAETVLESAEKEERQVTGQLQLCFDAGQFKAVSAVLKKNRARIVSKLFKTDWHLTAEAPVEKLEHIKDLLLKKNSGRIKIY